MRLGVLDIGSNTGHLLVVDAHRGAAPLPAYSYKQPLRLAEHLDDDGAVSETGVRALADFVASALQVAEDKGCEEMLGFATSAVRDATDGKLQQTITDPAAPGWDTFHALLPVSSESELFNALGGATRGTAWYTSELDHYEELREPLRRAAS